MVDFDPGKIVSVKITEETATREENVMNLTRKTSGDKKEWRVAEGYPFKLDPDKVMEYLKIIKQIKANEIADSKKTEHFNSPNWILTLGTEEGEKITFTRGAEQRSGAYYFKVSGRDYNFLIAPSTFKNFNKKETVFFDKNIFALNEPDIKELNITGTSKRKKYTAIKNAETGEWKTKKGAALDTANVKAVIQSLKGITLKTFPEANIPKKNILTYEITKTDGQILNFAISKEVTAGEKQYYCLKIENAATQYYIENNTLKKLKLPLQNLS